MDPKTKAKPAPKKAKLNKPDGRPKVKQGTGRASIFLPDSLFEDDLRA